MAPHPAPTARADLRSLPWKPFGKTENLLDAGINKKYQGNTVCGVLYPHRFGGGCSYTLSQTIHKIKKAS